MEIVSREDWGAQKSKSNATMQMPVPHIFIHHSVTQGCNDFSSCTKEVKSIQNYHMNDRGWDDIGYNFLIGGDGRVYYGRGWTRIGAHTYGFNNKSIAFCLLGDFSNKTPSQQMLNTTQNLIQCAIDEGYVTSDFKLHGHRDAGCTECPGDALYEIIKTWPNFQAGPLPGKVCYTGS